MSATHSRFQNQVALITGGSSGIGKAIALRLAKEGAKIGIVGRTAEKLTQARHEIEKIGGEVLDIQGNVASAKDCQRMVSQLVTQFGKINLLCTSAGIHGGGHSVIDTSEDLWNEVISIDLKGAFLSSKYALPELQKQGGGAVVHISSIGGQKGMADGMAFQAAKGGLDNLTRHMAVAHASNNIRVNCVCPGVVLTPMTENWLNDVNVYQRVCQWHPLNRLGKAEEVAAAAAFLLSDEAAFITGVILPVDGGYLAAGAR